MDGSSISLSCRMTSYKPIEHIANIGSIDRAPNSGMKQNHGFVGPVNRIGQQFLGFGFSVAVYFKLM